MLTFSELITLIGLSPAEVAERSYLGVNSLDQAGPEEVSFLGNLKYQTMLAETKAGVVLVPKGEWNAPSETVLLEVENPSASFSHVVDFFQKQEPRPAPGISPGAFVDLKAMVDDSASVAAGAVIAAGAVVGKEVVIGAGVSIGTGASIGEGTLIYPNVTIRENCRIGNRVIIQPNTVIGSDGFGFELVQGRHEKVPQVGIVVLEDDVEVGSCVCVDRARFGETIIGEGSKIDNLVQIAHNVKIGKHSLLVAQSGIAGSSTIGNYVTVAAQSGVAGHVEIGDQVVLAARAAAFKSLSNPGVYMGMPARPMNIEQRKMAALSRLPKLLEEVRSLKKMLEKSSGD